MTKEEIRKILDNTKVYVNGKSKEIQEKLFSFGYHWTAVSPPEVCHIRSPFLFIYENEDIAYSKDVVYFKEHEHREITAEEILSLEITEPSYRPFKDVEECWQEMLKHQPFGWLKNKREVEYNNIMSVYGLLDYKSRFENYTFADGTPFGIMEE